MTNAGAAGRRLVVAGLAVMALAACGRKGPPLAPLRPIPGAIAGFAAQRVDDRITLSFTVPKANRDGSTPSAVEHVEIYVLEAAAGAPAPTPAQVLAADNLLTSVDVRPADSVRAPGDPPDRRPGAGEPGQFVDVVTRPNLGTAGAPTRHYVAVGVSGRRKGEASPVVSVPLSRAPSVLRAGGRSETLRPHASSVSHQS